MEALIGGITAVGVAVAVVTLWRRIQEEVDALQIKGWRIQTDALKINWWRWRRIIQQETGALEIKERRIQEEQTGALEIKERRIQEEQTGASKN